MNMNLLVLAAGRGTRLEPYTDDRPKPLVEIDDERSILEKTLMNAMAGEDFKDIIILTGYLKEKVETAAENYGIKNIETINNPDYATTGPITSMLKAEDRMWTEDFTVINGDTYYKDKVFDKLSTDRSTGIYATISTQKAAKDDYMKVKIQEGSINQVGKEIAEERSDGISAGCVAIKGKEYREKFVKAAKYCEKEYDKIFWHNILNELAEKGYEIEPIEVPSESWFEIDTPAELQSLREQLEYSSSKSKRL